MERFTVKLLTMVLLLHIAPAVSAKPKGDWGAVKVALGHSIAVKTTNGETYYGLLRSADDTNIVVQVAGKDDFTGQEISFRRKEIQKVWRAKLRFGERNIAKAGWIGAGVGAVTTVVTLTAVAGKENADRALVSVWFPFIGAGIGAIAGAYWKKKHKKQELLYSI